MRMRRGDIRSRAVGVGGVLALVSGAVGLLHPPRCDEMEINRLVQQQPAADGMLGAFRALVNSGMFKQGCWEQRALLIKQVPDLGGIVASEELHDLVLDTSVVNTVQHPTPIETTATEMGSPVTTGLLKGLWKHKAALVVHHAGLVLPGLAQACLQAAKAFGLPTDAELYVTGEGLIHHEPVAQNTLVLQIAGYQKARISPSQFSTFNMVQEHREVFLAPGDIVYLPRGWYYETSIEHGPSMRKSDHGAAMYAMLELTASSRWHVLWCAAVHAVWGSEPGRSLHASGSLGEAVLDLANPRGTYFQASLENSTIGLQLQQAAPVGFLMPAQQRDKAALLGSLQVQVAELGKVRPNIAALKELLGAIPLQFAVQRLSHAHTELVERFQDLYLSFLGEPTTMVGGDNPYSNFGGMHLNQDEKQALAAHTLGSLHAEGLDSLSKHDAVQGFALWVKLHCTGSGRITQGVRHAENVGDDDDVFSYADGTEEFTAYETSNPGPDRDL